MSDKVSEKLISLRTCRWPEAAYHHLHLLIQLLKLSYILSSLVFTELVRLQDHQETVQGAKLFQTTTCFISSPHTTHTPNTAYL